MPLLNMTNKVSLGIDITADRINLALLQQTRDGIKLLKTASGPVPTGAISQGNVKVPVALANAIKELQMSNKMRAGQATVSLVARPVVIQIMDMPKKVPGNIGLYVQNEVKHCAILPNKNIAVDYCGIPSSGRSGSGRVFVVATENEKIVEMIRALTQAGLNIQAVEPAIIACARALYAKKIEKNFDSNVLIATIRDDTMALCVFRNQSLDFIRSKQISQPEELCTRLAEEISAILQFYEIEVADNSGKWQFLIAPEKSGPAAQQITDFLQERFRNVPVEVSTPDTIGRDTPVVNDSDAQKTSLTALGLAMKPLNTPQPKLKINLLPAETVELSDAKKHVLITANVIGALIIVIILAVGSLSYKLKNARKKIELQKQKQASGTTEVLLKQQQVISQQCDSLSAKLDETKKVFLSCRAMNWSRILDDIRQRTPTNLCITNLLSDDNTTVMLRGQSISYEAVYLFVDMLGKSTFIESANIIGTEKDSSSGGLITYSIACSLMGSEGT